ncbi:DNA repair protein [Rhodonellum psychrophilum GCM71 = DSM 17998]|uniref:DNA repair protein RecN n=2 Tax=Rhodonellum TaxID=336827 RepID=U5BXU0_9BACT|nr:MULTISPECIES: DNA repair protein RecN [Rhodonellum]ERM81436.1 DNA repair protein [Rhodonellum psychrophilum GCM71 = DSM 17998]SDZ56391.1 DNA replication and repair protein RecN [Rhodonellum ikkaensis]
MLKSLSITNYALIHSLEMEPSKSLNMITGETGAGKSIMLGAMGLLLGNRADTKTLFDSGKKCIVEGQFSIEDYGLESFFALEELDFEISCIIRREISPTGKSRAFINDTPVKLETLKELGKALMDIHSQHDNLLLGEGDYQLDLIDAFSQCQAELTEYQSAYKAYQQNKKAYEKLSQSALELNKEADFNKFQLEELSSLKLQEGEQADLESMQEILENAEEIKTKINEILAAINDDQFGAIQMLGTANQGLQQLRRYAQKFDAFNERFQSVLIELKDIAESLEDEDQNIEVDFEKLETVRDRLSKIYHLQKKHGLDSVEALIVLEQELADKAFRVDHLEEALAKLKKEMLFSEKSVLSKAEALSKKRKSGFKPFGDQLRELLEQLGMENARVEFSAQTIVPTKRGIDQIDILFSSNKGIKPQALKQVASGGEFSRLIFAIKYIMADKMALPTLIFDEIDTGVSGEVALQMVRMMQDIARKHQVICISHLPQVAAKGDQHYFVYKDNSAEKTISKIKLLNPVDRITEIAKMIAGANPSATAFESARELLEK